jgi:hypothetical protein
MRTNKLIALALVLFLALPLVSAGCSLDRAKDLATGEPGKPGVAIHRITYDWARKIAAIMGTFTTDGQITGVRIVVGEKLGEDVVPWFEDVYYIRQDVKAGDPFFCESYDVKPPSQQEFEWKAVVTDVF